MDVTLSIPYLATFQKSYKYEYLFVSKRYEKMKIIFSVEEEFVPGSGAFGFVQHIACALDADTYTVIPVL